MRVETTENLNSNHFMFRLVAEDGRTSAWATYTQIAILDDKAAITAYYAGASEYELVPLDFKTCLEQFAVGEAKPKALEGE